MTWTQAGRTTKPTGNERSRLSVVQWCRQHHHRPAEDDDDDARVFSTWHTYFQFPAQPIIPFDF